MELTKGGAAPVTAETQGSMNLVQYKWKDSSVNTANAGRKLHGYERHIKGSFAVAQQPVLAVAGHSNRIMLLPCTAVTCKSSSSPACTHLGRRGGASPPLPR